MISLRRHAVAAAMALATLSGTAIAQVNDYRDIKYPTLRQMQIPQPKRIQLANGMVIFLQEDHELPLIRGSVTIRGGERDVPTAKAGMVNILAQSWRTGGTASRTGDQLDEFLESRAASVETGGDEDSTAVSFNVLKQDFDAVFPIWLELIRTPAFRQEKIDLAKTQANTAISRRNDDPGSILGRESLKLGYGPESPYARQTEYATIAAITRDDLVAFHKQFAHPNNMIVGIVGDFDTAQMERKLRQAFESWPRGPQAPKPAFNATPARAGVYFVSKEDVTQSNIAMVHPGTSRNNPDYYALQVMNEIFGGGFSGRLMQRLRSQRGLTYGVGGGVGANWDHPGLFRVQMATKSQTTLESVEALRNEVSSLVSSPVTPEELSLAKESILNAYVFQMDTRAKALNQQVLLEFYGFPSDYFQKFPSEIQKVTAADVQRVAKQYVHPDRLAVLVVGKQADFEKPLSSLGNVTTIDVTIPEPGARPATPAAGAAPAAPAATASTAEGTALARKVRDFAGGAALINGIHTIRSTQTRNVVTPQGAMQLEVVTTVRYPNMVRQEMTTPQGTMTMVLTPDAGFAITPMGTQDLPSSQRAAAAGEIKTEIIGILKRVDDPKVIFTVGGTEKIGGTDTQILDIDVEGSRTRWYVDASGRMLRTVQSSARGETATDYSDWKKFGGLTMPASATMTRNGEKAGDVTVQNVEVNPAVDASAFTKPAA